MSIIHDALKKVQQGQSSKTDKTPAAQATIDPSTPDNIFSAPKEPTPDDQIPIEHLSSPPQNKAKSVLALLCVLAFTLGSVVFCYKQVRACFPQIDDMAVSLYFKILHKKMGSVPPQNLKPLAKITVNPPRIIAPPIPVKLSNPSIPASQASPASPAIPASPPILPNTSNSFKPYEPETLNIHGVMSNGSNNLVLIGDQVYQAGDDVDGVKIIKISLDSIIVDNNGVEQTVRVKN